MMRATIAVLALSTVGVALGVPLSDRLSAQVASAPAEPGTDWGQDILVGDVGYLSSVRKLATDADTNGDIYVAALLDSLSPGVAVWVWRSTNGGADWSQIYQIRGDSSTGEIKDYELIVGHDASGTLLYDFVLFPAGGSRAGLWLLRHRPPMQDSVWFPVVNGSDTLLSISADRNTQTPEHLFVVWGANSGAIQVTGSSDAGQSWGSIRTALSVSQQPSVCAGGNGSVYVAAGSIDSGWVSVARYDSNLGSPVPVVARLDSGTGSKVWNASVASDRQLPCSLQSAVLLYCHRDDSGRVAPYSASTRNGGANWATGIWPPANRACSTWSTFLPYVRRSYDDELFRGVATLRETRRNWDSLVYSVARSENPAVWGQRIGVNDSSASILVGARTGYSVESYGGYVVYAASSRQRVYFDGYDLVGMSGGQQERRAPAFPRTMLVSGTPPPPRLSLGPFRRAVVRVFDCSGRMASGITAAGTGSSNGFLELPTLGLKSGVYMCLVETPDWSAGFRLVMAR